MKTSILICIRSLCLFSLLICLPAFVHAQERLQIADLFSKYGEQKDVTRVELNGSILKSYRMTTYKSLVFKKCIPLSPGNSAGHCTRQARQRKEGAGGNGKRCAAQRLLPTERGGTQWKEAEPLHHFQDRKRLHGHFDLHRGSAQ